VEITEVRIKLMEDSEDRLRAFCSITFDHCFVVRDLKIIDGVNGPFVAMPSRKLTGHCQRCGHKNHLRAQYCNQCGVKLRSNYDPSDDSPQKLYADVAHPINSVCREMIQAAVIDELDEELARAGEPGYRSRYDDDFDTADAGPEADDDASTQSPRGSQPIKESRPPQESSSPAGSPPKPHFDRQQSRETLPVERPGRGETNDDAGTTDQGDEDDAGFGAGIF
jgi:stage V sporulation protein G